MYMNRTQHLQRPSALEQQPECRRPMTGNAPRKSRKAGVASDVISWNITANGYACTYAIHTDKDGRSPQRIEHRTGAQQPDRWA